MTVIKDYAHMTTTEESMILMKLTHLLSIATHVHAPSHSHRPLECGWLAACAYLMKTPPTHNYQESSVGVAYNGNSHLIVSHPLTVNMTLFETKSILLELHNYLQYDI